MIYSSDPADWRDLQAKVGAILRTCGCDVEIEKTIATVRGPVEVDVLAIDGAMTPPLTYICECKFWARAVDKSVIHGFRTVVADYGAHVGYIISRAGFQSGAFEAARNSNIRLVDWQQFQQDFLERWKEGRYEGLRPVFERLFDFYDYVSAPIGNAISGKKDPLDEFNQLIRRFSAHAHANPRDARIRREFPPILPYVAEEMDANGRVTTRTFDDYSSLFD